MPDDKIVRLDDIRAATKTVCIQYHEYQITLHFDREIGRWNWHIKRTHIFELTGTEETEKKAMKEAKRAADLVRNPSSS